MNDQNKKAFAAIMQDFAKYYSAEEPSSSTMREYFAAMAAEYTIEEVTAAFESHKREPNVGNFWPKVSHVMGQLIKAREVDAHEAWSDVLAHIRAHGAQVPYKTADKHTNFALDSFGGVWSLAQVPEASLHWKKTEFVTAYRKSEEGKIPVKAKAQKKAPEDERGGYVSREKGAEIMRGILEELRASNKGLLKDMRDLGSRS